MSDPSATIHATKGAATMNVYEDMTAAGDVTADSGGWVHVEHLPEKLDPDEAERLARVLTEAAAAARAQVNR